MSSNQNTVTVSETAQPSTVGKANVRLNKSDFDVAISNKGYDVYIDKVVKCPCCRKDGQPLSSCRNCGGTGYVYINRYKDKVVLQSINSDTKFKDWSEEKLGTVRISARSETDLAFMDRVTIIDSTVTDQQTIYPIQVDGEVRGKTIYDIIKIDEIFTFQQDNLKLLRLEENSDYSISGNTIVFNNKYSTWSNFTVSVRYKHNPSFHIIDMTRETMSTDNLINGVSGTVEMPVSAIGRRSHYVLDEQNHNGTYLLDNSYEESGCGVNKIKVIDKPDMVRVSNPSNVSVILEWNDPSTEETSFIVERKEINGNWVQVNVTNPNITEYTDTVTPNTTYFYRVATRENEYQSEWAGPIGIKTNP